ncbi:MAG: bifunctional homocysteine S-methyltransferase/methylenetetrahydrofolate reductase [Bacillota bacterium]
MSAKVGLIEYLRDHLLIGDGAMATWLYQHGVPIGVCYEELCLSKPALIQTVHREYYAAGARLIETNTFGANRNALSRYGLEHLSYRINWKAAVIAREAVGEDAWVVGSISSITGGGIRDVKMAGYATQFAEQAEALLAGGVDGIILETFLDLEELLLALTTLRPLTALPIIAQLACLEVGRTRDGYSLAEAFTCLDRAGADVVGLNCRLGPAEMLRSLEQTVVPEGMLLSIFPNAGRLGVTDGEYAYTSSPEYLAEKARHFREQGVRLIGGCCGTTPAHIQAVAEALCGLAPLPRVNPDRGVLRDEKAEQTDAPGYSGQPDQLGGPSQPVQIGELGRLDCPDSVRLIYLPGTAGLVQPSRPLTTISSPPALTIVDKVRQGPTVIVEFDPPKDLEVEGYLRGAANLQDAGADAITMADNSLAQTRMSNMALGAIVKQKLGIDPLIHLTCRDRNLIGQQSHLMGLHALGLHQVLVITGDPARFGDLPGASSVFDVNSFDLIRMVKQLNEGISFSGNRLQQRAKFVVGAAFNPHVPKFENALRRLEKKIEAGADYIMTQPVYDVAMIELIYESTKHLNIPIFIGIMPLTSSRNAEFLHNEVPGIRLTDAARERMRQYTGEAARQEGVAMAKELVEAAQQYFQGIYLITPFAYHEMTAELTRFAKKKAKKTLAAIEREN